MRKWFSVLVAGILAATMSAGGARAQVGSTACDRACLEGFVDKYLDAVIAHDPKLLPLARNVRFTENGVRLEIGDSHWKTVIGEGSYRLFVTDAFSKSSRRRSECRATI